MTTTMGGQGYWSVYPEEENVTTDVYHKALFPAPAVIRPRLANWVMRFATRINWAESELCGLASVVRPGDSVIDVGAAHGMYTLPLAHFVGPTGRVDSFEPHPRQQRTLRMLRRLIGACQISVNNFAVGEAPGERTMRLPIKYGFPIYGHAHITAGATDLGVGVKIRQWDTSITSVDAWRDLHEIDRVAFIKVDVEGFEPQVILGATET
ncbi:MAG: FkbM family methyltransferase, partial [Rhodoglobus sp.]|nr:FkbM family methyltransferase [Rhodoglobus sp.]